MRVSRAEIRITMNEQGDVNTVVNGVNIELMNLLLIATESLCEKIAETTEVPKWKPLMAMSDSLRDMAREEIGDENSGLS